MKYYKVLYILFLGSISIMGCQSGNGGDAEDAEVENLYEEVMYIHDDVMPKISLIQELQGKIKASQDGGELDAEMQTAHQDALLALNTAEQAMWDWMHAFSDNYGKTTTKEEKMAFLNEEKIAITDVRDKMLNSISQAEELLIQ
jgi:hypothetical protein